MYKNFSRSLDRGSESGSGLIKSSYQSYNQPVRSNYQSPTRPPPRQITYPAAVHFAADGWEYDPINDTYHAAVQPPHPPDHTPRNQGNTHDEGDAYAN